MARIRSIKPSIWTDQRFIRLSRDERLLCLGMISHADDEGRLFASPTKLAGDVFPADEIKPALIRSWRDAIATVGLIDVYTVDGTEYAEFPRWTKHQRISHPQASALPSRNDSALVRGTEPEPLRPSCDAPIGLEGIEEPLTPLPGTDGSHDGTHPNCRGCGTNPRAAHQAKIGSDFLARHGAA